MSTQPSQIQQRRQLRFIIMTTMVSLLSACTQTTCHRQSPIGTGPFGDDHSLNLNKFNQIDDNDDRYQEYVKVYYFNCDPNPKVSDDSQSFVDSIKIIRENMTGAYGIRLQFQSVQNLRKSDKFVAIVIINDKVPDRYRLGAVFPLRDIIDNTVKPEDLVGRTEIIKSPIRYVQNKNHPGLSEKWDVIIEHKEKKVSVQPTQSTTSVNH